MKKTIKQLSALYAASFLMYTGSGLFITSISAKLYALKVNTVMIGIVNSSLYIGIALGSIFSIFVLQKVGHIRSFCFFCSLYALEVLFHILSNNIYFWILFRLGLGFSTSGLLVVIESWLNEKSDTSNRSSILSYYTLTFYLSYLISVSLLSLNLSITNIFILSTIFTLFSLLPISLTKIKEPIVTQTERISFPNLLKIVPLSLLGSFLAGITANGFITMGSIYILKLGFGSKEISIFLACAIGGGFLVQIPIGKFSDKYGRRNAIILVSLISFIASCILLIFVHNIYMQYIGAFLMGLGIFTFYSLSLARANDVIKNPSDIVEVNRGLLLAYSVGSLITPVLSGVLLEVFLSYGFISLFLISSFILCFFAITRDSVPLKDRSVYVPIVGDTGSIVSQMDIREENNSQEIQELHNKI